MKNSELRREIDVMQVRLNSLGITLPPNSFQFTTNVNTPVSLYVGPSKKKKKLEDKKK